MADPILWEWRGRVPYRRALAEQRERRQAILNGQADEVVWLLEHDPVITTGRRPADGIAGDAVLAARGIERVQTERGGLATYHGPGQLVAYLLLDAPRRGWGVRRLVQAIEDVLIGFVGDLGVVAGRRAGAPGVWVGDDKIAALGLHFRKGVSMHGLALNICPDLSAYGLFVPCGIADAGVTSLARLGVPEAVSGADLGGLAAELGRRLSEGLRQGDRPSTLSP